MNLKAPSIAVYIISSILIVLIVMSKYFGIKVPVLSVIVAGHPFEVTLVAWALLFAGVTFKI
jgi:hypothetical protein